jgi:GNAT superfamily N-acetyltransferase
MTLDDVEAAGVIQLDAFDDLDRRTGEAVSPRTSELVERVHRRMTHLVTQDPAGSWVATDGDHVVGAALALRRESLWGLSLLVVDPSTQSGGAGRQLLDATLRHAEGCAAVIMSSVDHRAIRLYATSGFTVHPQLEARGDVGHGLLPAASGRVREGSEADWAMADELGRRLRGAGYGEDHTELAWKAAMFVVDDGDGRGLVYVRPGGEVIQLLATDDETATALLWRGLAHCAELGVCAGVGSLTANQQWAIRVALAARLQVRGNGPVLWRGMTPPPHFLPSGVYF